jgi:hypothetical protein
MEEFQTYHIEVLDRVDEKDIHLLGPLQITGMQVTAGVTRFAIHTDQSGLIGLLRHLHGRGFVLLSVQRERNA